MLLQHWEPSVYKSKNFGRCCFLSCVLVPTLLNAVDVVSSLGRRPDGPSAFKASHGGWFFETFALTSQSIFLPLIHLSASFRIVAMFAARQIFGTAQRRCFSASASQVRHVTLTIKCDIAFRGRHCIASLFADLSNCRPQKLPF
jgi:hypothetical protein